METAQVHPIPPKEISLKGIILFIKSRVNYVFSKWITVLICGIIGMLSGLAVSFLVMPKYRAELSFVLEDSKSGGLGAYASLASQFGLDLPGASGGSGIFVGDNILTFLQSRLMVRRVLLSTIMENGRIMSMADRYIEITRMRNKWKNQSSLVDLHYPVAANPEKFSIVQDSILQIIYEHVTKKELDVTKPDKKLSFINVSYTSPDERFAQLFVIRLAKEATDFYIDMKTQRSKTNVDKLQAKADSILALLNIKTVAAAASQDLNLNPIRKIASVNTELVTRDKTILMTMYGEIIKNLELAKMSMAQETPIIQVVDTPILPLKKQKIGKVTGVLIGGILAGVLCVIYLLLRQFYKEIMA